MVLYIALLTVLYVLHWILVGLHTYISICRWNLEIIVFVLQIVTYKVRSLEALQDKTERELRVWLVERPQRDEEIRRLTRALHNLKRYTG